MSDQLRASTDVRIPDAPLFVADVSDEAIGLRGWVAIHSLGASGACGGVRLYPDVSLLEVKELARAMTYKYSYFERQMGGAKAGVQIPMDAPREERDRVLQAFGLHIAPLLRHGLYHPWTDMNCGKEDLDAIYQGAGLWHGRIGDSSYHTALSAFAGVIAASEFLGIKPAQARITIEGAGNVGVCLAQEIARWGGKVIGATTRIGGAANAAGLDVDQIVRFRATAGDAWVTQSGAWERISHQDLFSLDANIHVPCARVHSLTAEYAKMLKCRAVVPAANVPCTPDGQQELERRGIILLPDFVINGGGIVGTGLADLGSSEDAVRRIFIGDFKDMCLRMLQRAEAAGITPYEAAALVSHKNFGALYRSGIQRQTYGQRLFHALSWRGIIPKSYRLRKTADHLVRIVNERFTGPITVENRKPAPVA